MVSVVKVVTGQVGQGDPSCPGGQGHQGGQEGQSYLGRQDGPGFPVGPLKHIKKTKYYVCDTCTTHFGP